MVTPSELIMLTTKLNPSEAGKTTSRRPSRTLAVAASMIVVTSLMSAIPAISQANPTSNNAGTNSVDNMRDGWDSNEPLLTPTRVTSSNFGQQFATQLQGQVYAQPIIANNKLIVATEDNIVYGLDPTTGSKIWTRDLAQDDKLNQGLPAQHPWPAGSATVSCSDLLPNIGITSTPVYNAANDTLYFVNKWDNGTDHLTAHYFMHAVDPSTGSERANFPHEISGHPSNDPSVTFNPFAQLQRPGLLLLDGVVYVAFGSHCDFPTTPPYRGFVVGVNATSGTQTAMWTTETTLAEVGGAGIWQSGAGLMSDGSGHIFFSTGNGISPPIPTGATSIPGSDAPNVNTFSQSIVRLQVQPDRSLAAADFFTPSDAAYLDAHDLDISSGGPVGLPDSFSTSPHLMTVQGKDGKLYLLNRDSLGGRTAANVPSNALATIVTGESQYGRQAAWDAGADGRYVYSLVHNLGLRAYTFGLTANGKPTLTDAGASPNPFYGFGSGSPVITSDGSTGGTVWVTSEAGADGTDGTLHAFDAIPSNGVLNEIFTAPIGYATKFSTPMSYQGRIYVGTRCNADQKTWTTTPCSNGMIYGFGSPTTNLLAASPLDLGTGPTSQALTGSLTLTASTSATVAIRAVSVNSPFSAGAPSSWRPSAGALPVTVPAGSSVTIPITFNSAVAGTFNGTISVLTDVGTFEYSLRAAATKHELLVTGPTLVSNAVVFPVQPTGTSRTINIKISNMSATPESITGITAPTSPFSMSPISLPITLGAAGQQDSSVIIPVTFTPTAAPSDGSARVFTGELDVVGTANLPTPGNPPCARASTCIGLKGTAVIAQPHLTYTPLATAFGSVAIGKSVTRSFSVTNDGNLPVTIVKAKAPVSAFSSTKPIDEGTTIPVGDVVHVNITFAPTAVGPKTDHYTITPNAGSGVTTIAFSGNGIDVPSMPTLVRATPNTKSVRITWAPPTSTGGLTIMGYRVTASPGGRTCTTTSTGRACSVTNLVNGTRYTFAVRAVNSLGASRTAGTTGLIRVGAPTAPRNLKVIGRSTGATTFSWLTPSSAGAAPIKYYQVQLSSDGGRTWSKWTSRSIGPGPVAHLTGLTKGITYRLNVHAVNSYGDGVNAALTFIQTT